MTGLLREIMPLLIAIVGVISAVSVARINRVSKDVSVTREQVTNDHASADAPSNLRVQMDQIQEQVLAVSGQMSAMAGEHREYRSGNDAIIHQIRQSQQENLQMTMQAVNALNQGLNGLQQTVAQLLAQIPPQGIGAARVNSQEIA